jgi:hypothetical protein
MFVALVSNDKFTKLCLSKDNWPVWSKKMLRIMKVSKLNGYLFGCIPKPNITTDPVLHHHWVRNNNKLVSFLEMYVDDGELPTLVSDNAHTVWTNLITRHEKQGPITVCEISVLAYMPKQSPLKTSCSCSLCLLDLNVKQTTFIPK